MFKNCKIVAVNAYAEEYHAPQAERGSPAYVISSSVLRAVFAKCPEAWRDGWEMSESDAKDYGSLVDCLVLQPDTFDEIYAVQPATYIAEGAKKNDPPQEKPWNNNATACKEWRKERAESGHIIVSANEVADAWKAVKRLHANPQIKAFIDASEKQVWVKGEWHDPGTGLIIPAQCLIDLVEREVPLTRQRIGDLKTTKNAAPLAWARWARFAGYDVQAAWNLDLFNAASNRAIDIFEFILSESEPPYQTGRRVAVDSQSGDPESDEGSAIVSGRRQYRKMLANYCKCLKFGKWPGYDDTDESSGGATELRADPYEEQRRLFAPKFEFGEEPEQAANIDDIIP